MAAAEYRVVQAAFTYFSVSVKSAGAILQLNMDLNGEWIAGHVKEVTMDIVYAAEKPSIASVLSDHISREVDAREIDVRHNPDETGSFLIQWNLHNFVMLPNGEVESA